MLRNIRRRYNRAWDPNILNIDPTPSEDYPKVTLANVKPTKYNIKMKKSQPPLRPLLIDFKSTDTFNPNRVLETDQVMTHRLYMTHIYLY